MNSELILKELRYLRGRKIEKVRQSQAGGFICLYFEGGNFCVFTIDGYADPAEIALCADLDYLSPWIHGELEIMPAKEFTKLKAMRKASQDAQDLKMRRAQYEELKKEFEGEDQ